MVIRSYVPSDCEVLAALFYQTVHTVNAKDYTQAQLDAWADGQVEPAAWDRSFRTHFTAVAEEQGVIIGFGDIDRGGYLDRLYVHSDYQRQGIGTALCDLLEQVVAAGVVETHASLTAVPFFLHRGYRVIRPQQVIRHGISLTNIRMEKVLVPPPASGSGSTLPPGGPPPAPPVG